MTFCFICYAGDKIPWNVCLQNCSIYTIHSSSGSTGSLQALQLVKPATVSCTVGVSYKYQPPTSDNISALGLCLHTDMRSMVVSTSFQQVCTKLFTPNTLILTELLEDI